MFQSRPMHSLVMSEGSQRSLPKSEHTGLTDLELPEALEAGSRQRLYREQQDTSHALESENQELDRDPQIIPWVQG